MSGRTLHLRDGKWITNRKTLRRNPRTAPENQPAWHLSFPLPGLHALAVPGHTGIIGVLIDQGTVTAIGRNRAWTIAQAETFLAQFGIGPQMGTFRRADKWAGAVMLRPAPRTSTRRGHQ